MKPACLVWAAIYFGACILIGAKGNLIVDVPIAVVVYLAVALSVPRLLGAKRWAKWSRFDFSG